MDRYENMDFARHNREVEAVWAAYRAGNPTRMPMITGISDRYFVLNRDANPRGVSFSDYSADKALMFDMQCEFARYRQFNILGDHEMGIPADGFAVSVDFQNYYEAAWLGCPVRFAGEEVPYAVPWLHDDNKRALFDRGVPGPFEGFMATAREYYDYFRDRAEKTTILGQRVSKVLAPFTGMDGMFTIACELRGADNLCLDMMEDPEYYHELMSFLTEATISRIRAWRAYMGEREVADSFHFADDSIALLSVNQYREMVLPYHRRLAEGISTMEKRGGAHLCGDATRLFETIRDELNVYSFDTGFPVNHGALLARLGPEVAIQGGPSVGFISLASAREIEAESRRIMEEVKPLSKKFIFRDGNDLPPGTPLWKIESLYAAVQKYGYYE